MADDTLDIYGDLPTFNYEDKLIKLEKEKELLSKQVENLQAELKEEQVQKEKFKKDNEALERNISSLYKTATSELRRKQQIIDDLRVEKDDIVFRRKKREDNRFGKDTIQSRLISLSRKGISDIELSDLEQDHDSENILARSPQNSISHKNNASCDKQLETHSTEKSSNHESCDIEIISHEDRQLEKNQSICHLNLARKEGESVTEEVSNQYKQNDKLLTDQLSADILPREKHPKQSSSNSSVDRRAERSQYHRDRRPHNIRPDQKREMERGENTKYTLTDKYNPYRNRFKDDYRTNMSFGGNNEQKIREYDYSEGGHRSSRQSDIIRGDINDKYSKRRNKFESERHDSSKDYRRKLTSDNDRQRRKVSSNTYSSYPKSHIDDEMRTDKSHRSSMYRNDSHSKVNLRNSNRQKHTQQRSSNYTNECSSVSLPDSDTHNSPLPVLNLMGNQKDGVISRPRTPHSDRSSQCSEKDYDQDLLLLCISEEDIDKSPEPLVDNLSKSQNSSSRDKPGMRNKLSENIKEDQKKNVISREHIQNSDHMSGNLESHAEDAMSDVPIPLAVVETMTDRNKKKEYDQPIDPPLKLNSKENEDNIPKNMKDSFPRLSENVKQPDSIEHDVISGLLINTAAETQPINTGLLTHDNINKTDEPLQSVKQSTNSTISLKKKKTSIGKDSVNTEETSVTVSSAEKEREMSKKNAVDIASKINSNKFTEVVEQQKDNSDCVVKENEVIVKDTVTSNCEDRIENYVSTDSTDKINKEQHKIVKQIVSDISDSRNSKNKECENLEPNEISYGQENTSSGKDKVKHKESHAVSVHSKSYKNIILTDNISEGSTKSNKHNIKNAKESKQSKDTGSVQLQRRKRKASPDKTITAVTMSQKENEKFVKKAKIVKSKKSLEIDSITDLTLNQRNIPESESDLTNTEISKQSGSNTKHSQSLEAVATVNEKAISENDNCLKMQKKQLHGVTSTPIIKTNSTIESEIIRCFNFSLPISPVKLKNNGNSNTHQCNTSYSEKELIEILEMSNSDNSEEIDSCSNIGKEPQLQHLNKKEGTVSTSDTNPSKLCTESNQKTGLSKNSENSTLQTTQSHLNQITNTVKNVNSENSLQDSQVSENDMTNTIEDLARKDALQSNVSSVTTKGNILSQITENLHTKLIANDRNKSHTLNEIAVAKTKNISGSNEQCEFTRHRKRKLSVRILSSADKESSSNIQQRQKEDENIQKSMTVNADMHRVPKDLSSQFQYSKDLPPPVSTKDTYVEYSKDETTKTTNNGKENRYGRECAQHSDVNINIPVSKSQNELLQSNIINIGNLNTSVRSNSSSNNCNVMQSSTVNEKHTDSSKISNNVKDTSALSQPKTVLAKFKLRRSKTCVKLEDSDSLLSIKSNRSSDANVSGGSLSNSETEERQKSFAEDIVMK